MKRGGTKMRKRYIGISAGLMLVLLMFTGCGAGPVNQGNTSGSTQREEELQAEIDALQQEIDNLKNSQDQQDASASDGSQVTDSTQTSDNNQAANNSATPYSSGSTGNEVNVAISLEEAQNIALERVPGATSQNISVKLDWDDGWYIYEGDILYNRMEYEFEIDANTGNILKWEEERW